MKQIALFLCLVMLLTIFLPVRAEAALTGRQEFYFGISGHHRHYEAYPEANLEEQIRLAAELGSDIYRINCIPTDEETLSYLDQVVSLCLAHNMQVMLVLDAFPGETYEEIYRNAVSIAAYFANKITFIQAGNELDNHCITSPFVDGSSPAHFETEAYDTYVVKLDALLKGIKEGCSQTKTVVNIAYRHYGFLQRLMDDGLSFDVIGWDWYSNMGDYAHTFPSLLAFHKPVMVCETNLWDGIGHDNTPLRTEFLTEFMKYIYHYPSDLCLGFIIYELLDEPAFGENNNEAHFGLITCQRDGTVIAPKQAYYEIQKLWISPYFGDVNANGSINADDALCVLKTTVGKINMTETQKRKADVNGDAKINAHDALLILQFVVGRLSKFPIEQ